MEKREIHLLKTRSKNQKRLLRWIAKEPLLLIRFAARRCRFSGAAVPMPSGFPPSQSIPQLEWFPERHW
jgi:hypothetical protein